MLVSLPSFSQGLDSSDYLYLADPDPRLNGEQVRALQRFLLFHGCYLGPDGIDGWFGRDTEAALLEYQESKGLEKTGRIQVEEIEDPLNWFPQSFSPRHGATPDTHLIPQENPRRPDPGADGYVHMNNYFGSFSIPSSEGGYEFSDFIVSPSGRFVAARAFHPEDNLEYIGTGLRVWDVLSGDDYSIYPHDAFLNESYWGLHQGYSYPRVTQYFWTEEEQLVILVDVIDNGGGTETGYILLDATVQAF